MPEDVIGCTESTLKASTCVSRPKGPGKPLNYVHALDCGLKLLT